LHRTNGAVNADINVIIVFKSYSHPASGSPHCPYGSKGGGEQVCTDQ